MDSEKIMQKTFSGVVMFVEKTLNDRDSKVFRQRLDSLFPTWHHMWQVLEKWIRVAPLTDMASSILSFAEMLPDYSSFAQQLKYSLSLHEEFWNQVYCNLILSKKKLPPC